MVCADYNGHCQADGDVVCSTCGQSFCWDHILTLRVATQEAIGEARLVCRNCTEHLFEKIEEDRLQCKRKHCKPAALARRGENAQHVMYGTGSLLRCQVT